MTVTIEAAGVGRRYGDLEVLEGVGFTVARGEVMSVIGPSGCGKSTLLSLLAGLEEPDSGTVSIEGRTDPEGRRAGCALMPQDDCLLPWFSALDNAGLAIRNRGGSRREARDAAHPVFERLGLSGFERARPGELSGGMRQRVAFARTWLAGKGVLLLDEPFASLDGLTRRDLQEWLAPILAERERSTVLVTHDLDEALYLGSRVLVLSGRPGNIIGVLDAPERDGMGPIAAAGTPAFGRARQELAGLLAAAPTGASVP
jgi:ABC-type nitrate/sulfonate/bicarbonate transport system ATPase subunit